MKNALGPSASESFHVGFSPQNTEKEYSISKNGKGVQKGMKISKKASDSPECSKNLDATARHRSKSEDYRPCVYRKTEEHFSTSKTEKKEVKFVEKTPKRKPNSTLFRACLPK